MKSSNDCTCDSPHVDCWSSRCRHDALKALQIKCDELESEVRKTIRRLLTTEQQRDTYAADVTVLEQKIVQAEIQRDELEKATEQWGQWYWEAVGSLNKYGKHAPRCQAGIADSHHACTCGLSWLRAKARQVQP